jgi:hypothetical protein
VLLVGIATFSNRASGAILSLSGGNERVRLNCGQLMNDNKKSAPKGLWALMTAVVGWLIPMAVYYMLMLIFGKDPVWAEVGPYLMISFAALAVFAQISAVFLGIIAWPARLAKVSIVAASLLLSWNALLLLQALSRSK